jgi:LmbE family N-acetylglucosaminyl deacetylase
MERPEPPIVLTAPPSGRVLVLVPHPDDESLGCGGAVALHRRQGDPVRIVFATGGGAGDPLGHYAGSDYVAIRREEARRAAEVLGASDLVFWNYDDGKLAEARDLADRVGTLLASERPDLIYRPSIREIHPDHWALGVAVARALQRHAGAPTAFAYEIWATVQPTHVLDITGVWDLKRKAVEQHQSQLRYNDYLHMVAGLNAYRTIHVPSARYVEAFEAR